MATYPLPMWMPASRATRRVRQWDVRAVQQTTTSVPGERSRTCCCSSWREADEDGRSIWIALGEVSSCQGLLGAELGRGPEGAGRCPRLLALRLPGTPPAT